MRRMGRLDEDVAKVAIERSRLGFGVLCLRCKDSSTRLNALLTRFRGSRTRFRGLMTRLDDSPMSIKDSMTSIKDSRTRFKGSTTRLVDSMMSIKGSTMRFKGSTTRFRGWLTDEFVCECAYPPCNELRANRSKSSKEDCKGLATRFNGFDAVSPDFNHGRGSNGAIDLSKVLLVNRFRGSTASAETQFFSQPLPTPHSLLPIRGLA